MSTAVGIDAIRFALACGERGGEGRRNREKHDGSGKKNAPDSAAPHSLTHGGAPELPRQAAYVRLRCVRVPRPPDERLSIRPWAPLRGPDKTPWLVHSSSARTIPSARSRVPGPGA